MELVVISDFLSKVSKCFNFYIPLYIHSVSNFWAANESHYRMKSCCFFVFVLFFYMFDNKVCLLRANIWQIAAFYITYSSLIWYKCSLGGSKCFIQRDKLYLCKFALIGLIYANLFIITKYAKFCQILV